MKQDPIIQDSSKAVREVLGKPPSWTIRFGTTSMVLGFLALFSLTALIRYNNVLEAEIKVTSKNPPVAISASQAGEVHSIFVEHDQKVAQGDAIAELRNPASFQDIQQLGNWLESHPIDEAIQLDSLPLLFSKTLRLGEVQDEYTAYYQSLLGLGLYDSLGTLRNQKKMQTDQLRERKLLLGQQRTKLEQYAKELALSKSQYDRNATLFEKGVISKMEYESAEARYLRDQRAFEQLKSDISMVKIAITDSESILQGLTLADLEEGGTILEKVRQHHRQLQKAILDYEQKYVFRSPIAGTVNMIEVWGPYQKFNEGEVLFVVFPENPGGIIGHLDMPASKSGKVKNGQEVMIKLSNYPFQQYGKLKGKVLSISKVPHRTKDTYKVYIKIPELRTSYGQEISMDRELVGTAEIITEKLSLLQRMLYGLRKLIDSN